MAVPGTTPIVLPGGGVRVSPVLDPAGNAPTDRRWTHPAIGVYLESERGSGEFGPSEVLDWRNIKMAMDGGDTTATLTVGLDAAKLTTAGNIGDQHFSQLMELLNPDLRIRIAQTWAAEREVYFQG